MTTRTSERGREGVFVCASAGQMESASSSASCLREGCRFVSMSSVSDRAVVTAFRNLNTCGLSFCEKHKVVHFDTDAGTKHPGRRNRSRAVRRKEIRGTGAEERRRRRQQRLRRWEREGGEECEEDDDLNVVAVRRRKLDRDRHERLPHNKYEFVARIRVALNGATNVTEDRFNSILQRLYQLFICTKENEERKNRLNVETIWRNCEERMKYLVACLLKELSQSTTTSGYLNRDPGSVFRTQAAFLISHDLRCDLEDLMPPRRDFAETPYVSRDGRR